jgi:hypothetical protein
MAKKIFKENAIKGFHETDTWGNEIEKPKEKIIDIVNTEEDPEIKEIIKKTMDIP